MALYDAPGLFTAGGRRLNSDGSVTIVCIYCERPIIRTMYKGFSTASHGLCEKLYNEGMTPEDIMVAMAKKENPEEVIADVYNGLGPGLFRASGFKERAKDVIEKIKTRVTRAKRNILKD